MKKDYSRAYTEVYEVLKHIPKNDMKKIPNKFIEFLEENMEQEASFIYNEALPFEKQEISDDGKLILAIIYRDYWASDEERKNIIEKEIADTECEEILKSQKYSYENLFRKNVYKDIEDDNENSNIDKQVVEYHENIIMKLLRKIRSLLFKTD